MDLKNILRLYVVLDLDVLGRRSPLDTTRSLLRGGVSALQLRAKGRSIRAQAEIIRALLPFAREAGVPLIINDHLELALALRADGVHLGVDDLPVALARRCFPEAIIGYSPAGIHDLPSAAAADYLGVGPIYPTGTKLDAGPPIGLGGLRAMLEATHLPIVAIGGIGAAVAAEVIAAGASGVAVCGAVLNATDPGQAAADLARSLPTGAFSWH